MKLETPFPFSPETWLHESLTQGQSFEASTFDLEAKQDQSLQSIKVLLKDLSPLVRLKFQLEISKCHDLDSLAERRFAISQLGFTKAQLKIHVEAVKPFNLKSLLRRKKTAPLLSSELHSTTDKIKEVFSSASTKPEDRPEILIYPKHLEVPEGALGVVRLHRLPVEEFLMDSFQEQLLSLPKPYRLCLQIQKLDKVRAKLLLEKKLKQSRGSEAAEDAHQNELTSNLLEKQFAENLEFFEYEFLIELIRPTAEMLFQDQLKIQNSLSDCHTQIETYGLYPSYLSLQPGHGFHVSQLDSLDAIAGVLPCWAYSRAGEVCSAGSAKLNQHALASEVPSAWKARAGQAQTGQKNPLTEETRSLLIHRKLDFLEEFDLFHPNYQVSNTLIVGRSGKGKSVLTGLLTTSLLNDPNVQVIKLDVGGSHSKECELLGGTEYQMRLDEPSGINPFEVLLIPGVSLSDQIGILSKFLGNLILEQGEVVLAKNVRAEIEQSVNAYIESNLSNPNLNSFFEFAKDFPRRNLLARWCEKGLYSSAFSEIKKADHLGFSGNEALSSPEPLAPRLFSRLRYFNFAAIFQAADPEFAQAGVAAVLAAFNMEMLKADGKRIVLICDETPFFVKSCFEFFKFSTANVRKYGHAVVLISQLSTDFIVGGDTGLIENSPQRFLFSIDGDEDEYLKRFNLNSYDIEKIKSLQNSPRRFSEVLLQENAEETKVLRARITPEEYWKLTTNKVDKEKLMGLLDAVPGLLLQEAITCLAMER